MTIANILLSPALAGMRRVNQWIVYVLADDPLRPGKRKKIPIHHVTGTPASVTDPANWTDVQTAAAAAQRLGPTYGVGFCFTRDCGYWFVDLDSCLIDGQWSALATQLCAQVLAGAAVEISSSCTGMHLFGRGAVPPHSSKNLAHRAELYTEGRFCAMSGIAIQGDCDTDLTAGISWVVRSYFPPRAEGAAEIPSTGPRADWRGPEDDDELLRRALRSSSAASAFGDVRATFADLFDANATVLSVCYPPDRSSNDRFDHSSADAALMAHLAFWTGADGERMVRLARRSRLVRDKWEREDYLARTVSFAQAHCRDVLQDKPMPEPPVPLSAASEAPAAPTGTPLDQLPDQPPAASAPAAPAAAMTARNEQVFLDAAAQANLFQGCVYVADLHKVAMPGGVLYNPERFNVRFGGHVFHLDARNEKTTKDAFEAFTRSQILRPPIVDGTAFKPALPYGTIVESEGRRRVNVYWPAGVRRVRGDPAPFLNHIARLFPDPHDQRVLLYYMAGCVQFAGNKFQWMPLIVGPEGNGKSFLSQCLAYAVGKRYTHWVAADKIGAQFNSWLFGRLLIIVEDINIGAQAEVWEKMKPMITGDVLEIEGKGIDQRTDEVVANFLVNSNHPDAIRKSPNDRRVCPLWCAQQTLADMLRDGITERYTGSLYDWAKSNGGEGYAIVADYLHSVEIPAAYGLQWLMGRAPRTSSTDAALRAGLGRIEQDILEQIDQDAPGFRGGWVSSTYLDRLLDADRASHIPRNRRREIMQRLGYDWHTGLPDGRVNSIVLPDGNKPRLYVLGGSPAAALKGAPEIARAYSAAQGVAGPARG